MAGDGILDQIGERRSSGSAKSSPRRRRDLGQARVRQPDRVDEGSARARDGRGRTSRRAASAGTTLVEYTGGSTGPSLAFVGRAKGYAARIVIADCFTQERILLMRALGATSR